MFEVDDGVWENSGAGIATPPSSSRAGYGMGVLGGTGGAMPLKVAEYSSLWVGELCCCELGRLASSWLRR